MRKMDYILNNVQRCARPSVKKSIIIYNNNVFILKHFPRCARPFLKKSIRKWVIYWRKFCAARAIPLRNPEEKHVRYCITSWGRCWENWQLSKREKSFTRYHIFVSPLGGDDEKIDHFHSWKIRSHCTIFLASPLGGRCWENWPFSKMGKYVHMATFSNGNFNF